MRRRRRTIGLAALALSLPLPAYALTQGETGGPASLSVSVALDSCGVSGSRVLCKLGVSFETIPGATSYTASVTSPDGSVTDLGSVPAGGTSVYVPYVGNGTYSVRVSAYGSPDEPGAEPELLESDTSGEAESSTESEREEAPRIEHGRAEAEAEEAGEAPEQEPAPEVQVEPDAEPEPSECVPAPAPVPVPVPELTPEEQAAIDEDAARVAAGEPSTLDPAITEKLAAIEAAEAENAAAAAAPPAGPCPAP